MAIDDPAANGECSSEGARFLALGAGVLGREAREAGNCGGGIDGEPMRNCSGRGVGRAGERGDESPGSAGGERCFKILGRDTTSFA